jgi:hypothetical protein
MYVYYSNHLIRQEKLRFILHLSFLCRIRDEKKRPEPGFGITVLDPQHCDLAKQVNYRDFYNMCGTYLHQKSKIRSFIKTRIRIRPRLSDQDPTKKGADPHHGCHLPDDGWTFRHSSIMVLSYCRCVTVAIYEEKFPMIC